MSNIERFGVSVDGRLLDRFDERNHIMGYSNRSEAIRDLIRDSLVKSKHWVEDDASVVGTVTLIYDHHSRDLTEKLNHIQHHHEEMVICSLHVHLDEDNCLEVVVLRGMGKQVKEIAHHLIAQKGVKHGKATLTTGGEDLW